VFVIWEPVLPTDLASPSTRTLARISAARVNQYWDKERLISQALGETDANSIVWDYVAVYQPGKLWEQAPPEPVYSSVPVVEAIDGTREAIQKVLQESKK
jgi:hypothetical protein